MIKMATLSEKVKKELIDEQKINKILQDLRKRKDFQVIFTLKKSATEIISGGRGC